MLVNWDPIMFEIFGVAIRWYGFLMAVSMGVGIYYLVKNGLKQDMGEDFLYNTGIFAIIGGIVGARVVYVATNWWDYVQQPMEILRIDHGGLSIHGALGGGLLLVWWYVQANDVSLGRILDLMVPGVGVGIALVRWGNIFNQEVLGRYSEVLDMRHPAQVYGSAIGIVALVIHNMLARDEDRGGGFLFWSFFFYYSILRGVIEETFRQNPLYLFEYVNTTWGIGFTTLTHLFTPLFVALAWLLRERTREA